MLLKQATDKPDPVFDDPLNKDMFPNVKSENPLMQL